MNRTLRVAVVGLGVGREHLRHWRALGDRFQITLVCDPDQDRLAQTTHRYGCQGVSDFQEVLNHKEVDVVDLCTPPHLHYSMAEAALKAGKHVICEKPVVSSVAEIDGLQRISAQTGYLCMPISQYRFGAGIQRLKFLSDQGLLGKPYTASIETHWLRDARYYAAPWRGRWDTERGGVILCHALHLHDLACFVLGDVSEVFAFTDTRVNDIETEDCAAVTMKMKSGALVTSNSTLGSSMEISRLRFCFEGLTAESHLEPYDPGRDPWTFTTNDPRHDLTISEALADFVPPARGFTGQFAGFYDAVTAGKPLPVTLDDAKRALELVTAIYASAESGHAVTLPLSPDHPKYTDWRP